MGKSFVRVILSVLWGIFVFLTYPLTNYSCETIPVEFEAINEEKIASAKSMMDELVKETPVEYYEDPNEITYEEAQMLLKIAMAEAEGEGIEGKAMVMAVVLNRVADPEFPDNIKDVIFQDKQFSPISDGRYYKADPDIECNLALAEIEQGKYSDIEALYFENASDSWASKNCQYLYKVGNHRFYK